MISSIFSLLDHPAAIHVDHRLKDPNVTSRLQKIDVFDFDQTLFRSPLPNPALWDVSFIGQMSSWNNCGTGWWLNPATLDLGSEAEASNWDGWWNEDLILDVLKSSNDPECLTVLMTGRCAEFCGDKLLHIIQAKGLQFDLIVAKPTTAVRIEPKQSSKQENENEDQVAKEIYLIINTFSYKHDFLYNILLEYPSIQYMRVWDDREGQVAKFVDAGKPWVESKMLESLEVTKVDISHQAMDQDLEKALVYAMVEKHNQQVEIEAKGGPLLVAGAGPMPPTRPELQDLRLWDPYETYIPKRRTRIELTSIVQYTGVLFSEQVQSFLKNVARSKHGDNEWINRPQCLQNQDISSWEVLDDMHVNLCVGAAQSQPNFLEAVGGLGLDILVEVVGVGHLEGKIWALKVQDADVSSISDSEELAIIAPDGKVYTTFEDLVGSSINLDAPRGRIAMTRKGTPNIALSYSRNNAIWPRYSNKIDQWESLRETGSSKRIILVGTIGEKSLIGIKNQNLGHLAVIPKAEVSIANILKQRAVEKSVVMEGRVIGLLVKGVQKEMGRLSLTNSAANAEEITTLAYTKFDEHFELK
ncbi:hypothetical protein BGZ76_001240 [Entomortierella beljakovae]|nr:hypothetical protein BGZ76_001240 [Entomortierella beljakovae]